MQFRIADLARDTSLIDRIPAVAERILTERPQLADKLVRRWVGDSARFAGV
jgi:ATP-dependent DNA helicase RecG